MQAIIERIRQDIQNGGGKIGPTTANRLMDVLLELAQRIEHLERRTL